MVATTAVTVAMLIMGAMAAVAASRAAALVVLSFPAEQWPTTSQDRDDRKCRSAGWL
jgi:hypothetical protein